MKQPVQTRYEKGESNHTPTTLGTTTVNAIAKSEAKMKDAKKAKKLLS